MNTEQLLNAYHAVRNGTEHYYRHSLVHIFFYSDGIKEMADAGCHWMVDVLATELPGQFRIRPLDTLCIVTLDVVDGKAFFVGEFSDDDVTPWKRTFGFTDMPAGQYKFLVGKDEKGHLLACLLSEY